MSLYLARMRMIPGPGENNKGQKVAHRVVELQLISKC